MRFLFRWWVFYPLAALLAAGLVMLSLGPALLDTNAEPVAGRLDGTTLVLEGEDLAHAEGSAETVHYVAREAAGWQATGLRVAVKMPLTGPVQEFETGVRVLLDPEQSLALGSGPFRVVVTIAPVPVTTAPELAIALDRGFPEWQTQKISAVQNEIIFDFPAAEMEGLFVSSVNIRPIATLQDYNYGVEIRSIRIIPAPQSAG